MTLHPLLDITVGDAIRRAIAGGRQGCSRPVQTEPASATVALDVGIRGGAR